MALLNNSQEIKDIITVGGGFDYDNLLPYIPVAEIEIEKILGEVLYQELLDYYDTGNGDIEEYENLIPYVQRPLVYLSFHKGFHILNVSIGNNGIGVVESNGLAPASKQRTDAAQQNMLDLAYLHMELLLKFLEKNKDSYLDWTDSSAYSEQTEFLLRNALMFHKWFRINESRLTYLNWIPSMRDAESLDVAPKISEDLLDELKTESLADNFSDSNKKIIDNVCKAIAYFTAFREKKDKYLEGQALTYIGVVQRYLNDHPEDFPTYRDSDIYVEEKTYPSYENEEDDTIFVFGGSL